MNKNTIAIPDNFNQNAYLTQNSFDRFNITNGNKIGNDISFPSEKDLTKIKQEIKLFSFRNDSEKAYRKLLDNTPILEVKSRIISDDSKDKEYFIKTGNYCGTILKDGKSYVIKSRFGDTFLSRMLCVLNDVFVSTDILTGDKVKVNDPFLLILIHLFIQKLEKASLFGLPKSYKSVDYHEAKILGRIDIQKMINKDIPFRGKISTVSREQREIIEIIDVLHFAIKSCSTYLKDEKGKALLRINNIVNEVKFLSSNRFPSQHTISKAKNHPALQKQAYAPFAPILNIAELLIQYKDLRENSKGKETTHAYLFDVSELFEIYTEKLLRNGLREKGWTVLSQETYSTYENTFFERKLIPDLVIKNGNDVAVFDTKYKKMYFKGSSQYEAGDVDRNDFFQIHTYLGYFKGQKDVKIVAGGLLYPVEGEISSETNISSENWLLNEGSFIIDGIQLNSNYTTEEIINSEDIFLKRMQVLLQKGYLSYNTEIYKYPINLDDKSEVLSAT
ncbi:MAG TPA: hypothetical protein VK169_14660 [Saprospiraceae bacterium]|nr:hypothetical protein [Saprospiraceae bacterium]